MAKNKIKNIIILARTPWGSTVKGRTHHLALEFSRNSKIIYIDPMPFVDLVRNFFSNKRNKFRVNKINKNLTVLNFPKIKPQRSKLSPYAIKAAQILFVKNIIKKFELKNFAIWATSPFHAGVVKNVGEVISCYDCSDKFSAIVDSPDLAKILGRMEKELLKKVDVVFVSSKALYDDCKRHNKGTFLIYNAVWRSYFKRGSGTPKDMRKVKKPILGFVGTINKFLDIELIRYIANYNKNWSVVLIGPHRNNVKLRSQGNLTLLGEKRYDDLPEYVNNFNVCLVPYKDMRCMRYVDFSKIYQYLACGKAIVATGAPEVKKFGSLCRISRDKDEFINNIKKALKEEINGKELVKKKRVFAHDNTWRRRAEEMTEIICRRYQ